MKEEKKTVAAASMTKEVEKLVTKKPPVKKTATKKTEIVENLHVEFSGKSYTKETLMKSVKDIWKYDYKKKAMDLKAVDLYVKPEEGKVYYVINKEVTGDFII